MWCGICTEVTDCPDAIFCIEIGYYKLLYVGCETHDRMGQLCEDRCISNSKRLRLRRLSQFKMLEWRNKNSQSSGIYIYNENDEREVGFLQLI